MKRRRIPVEVTPQEEAEQSAYYVCMRADGPIYFADNLIGRCSRCGCAVQYRPHAPVKPKKLCMECGLPDSLKAAAEAGGSVGVTEATAREVRDHFHRRGMN